MVGDLVDRAVDLELVLGVVKSGRDYGLAYVVVPKQVENAY